MVELSFIVIHEYDVTLGICFFIMRANIFYLTNDHKENERESSEISTILRRVIVYTIFELKL